MDTARTLSRLGFSLSEEQLLVGEAARELAQKRLAPRAAEIDRSGRYPIEEFRELAELGLHAVKVRESDGGGGSDNVGFALAMVGIGSACASTATILASSNLTAKILAEHADDEQKRRFLSPYTAGEKGPAAFALSEPGCGSDAAALTTRARLEGEEWVLDGEKMWITSGAHAGLCLLFARSDGPGPEGISAFVVERGTPGFMIGKHEEKMGLKGSGTVALSFESCRIPARNLIGRRGGGYGVALSGLGEGRVGIAALCIGVAERALAEGVAYAKERKAFGKRLTEFQNTEFVLADCRTELDASWLLMLRAAKLCDAGERAIAETSMAKLFASEAAGRIVDRMLQLHGGFGYSREFTVERLYRDIRVTRIYEGTSEVQRTVIARSLLRDGHQG